MESETKVLKSAEARLELAVALASHCDAELRLTMNVWRMQQFYLIHTQPEFLSQVVREMGSALPWGHQANAVLRVAAPAARLW